MLTKFYLMILALEATSSSTDKIRIIERHCVDNVVLRDLMRRALDPTITYGVKILPELHPLNEAWDNVTSYEQSMSLLDRLEKRLLTGGAAQQEITHVFSHLTAPCRDALRRILLKDLRCGVSAKTANKAVPDMVPEFCVQLAPSKLVVPSKLKYPIWAEIKHDGYRATRVGENLYSREGNTFDNFEEVRQALNEHVNHVLVPDLEIMSPLGFKVLKKRGGADFGKNVDIPIYGVIFDLLTHTHFKSKSCPVPFLERRKMVEELVSRLPGDLFRLSEGKIVHDADELREFYDHALAQGHEGLMVKTIDGHYTFARNATWQKMKPFDTVDLKCTGIRGGKGKYEGMMGAAVVHGVHDNKHIRTDIGSGWSDDERRRYYDDPTLIVGKTLECRFLEITISEEGEFYALRHGTFVRIRDDK